MIWFCLSVLAGLYGGWLISSRYHKGLLHEFHRDTQARFDTLQVDVNKRLKEGIDSAYDAGKREGIELYARNMFDVAKRNEDVRCLLVAKLNDCWERE